MQKPLFALLAITLMSSFHDVLKNLVTAQLFLLVPANAAWLIWLLFQRWRSAPQQRFGVFSVGLALALLGVLTPWILAISFARTVTPGNVKCFAFAMLTGELALLAMMTACQRFARRDPFRWALLILSWVAVVITIILASRIHFTVIPLYVVTNATVEEGSAKNWVEKWIDDFLNPLVRTRGYIFRVVHSGRWKTLKGVIDALDAPTDVKVIIWPCLQGDRAGVGRPLENWKDPCDADAMIDCVRKRPSFVHCLVDTWIVSRDDPHVNVHYTEVDKSTHVRASIGVQAHADRITLFSNQSPFMIGMKMIVESIVANEVNWNEVQWENVSVSPQKLGTLPAFVDASTQSVNPRITRIPVYVVLPTDEPIEWHYTPITQRVPRWIRKFLDPLVQTEQQQPCVFHIVEQDVWTDDLRRRLGDASRPQIVILPRVQGDDRGGPHAQEILDFSSAHANNVYCWLHFLQRANDSVTGGLEHIPSAFKADQSPFLFAIVPELSRTEALGGQTIEQFVSACLTTLTP